MKLTVRTLNPGNFKDLLYICPRKHLSDPQIKKGIAIKRGWFRQVYGKYGSPVRICYVDEQPVAQILYFPESIVPYVEKPRNGVLWINCIYNPYPEYQRLGCGRSLISSIIKDIREGASLFKGFNRCTFLSAYPFDTGEYFPMSKFYIKMGFKTYDGIEYIYEFRGGEYSRLRKPRYVSQPEDIDKAIMFYEPWCEYSYKFAYMMKEKIRRLADEHGVKLKFEIYDAWRHPEEYTRIGWKMLVVKSHIIKSFYGTKEFDNELKNIIKAA